MEFLAICNIFFFNCVNMQRTIFDNNILERLMIQRYLTDLVPHRFAISKLTGAYLKTRLFRTRLAGHVVITAQLQ